MREGDRLVPDPELQEHLIDMFELAASGMCPAEIARVLIKKGVKPPRAKLWHPETVLGILTNSIYDGRTMHNVDEDSTAS